VASVLVGALTIGLQGVVWSVIRSRNDLLSSGAVVAPAARWATRGLVLQFTCGRGGRGPFRPEPGHHRPRRKPRRSSRCSRTPR